MAQAEQPETLTWNRRTFYGESEYHAETGHDDLTIRISKEEAGWLIVIVDGSEWISRNPQKMKANTRWHYLKDAKHVAECWFFQHYMTRQNQEEPVPYIPAKIMEKMEELSGHLSLMAMNLRMHQEGREGEANYNASEIVEELLRMRTPILTISQDLAWCLE